MGAARLRNGCQQALLANGLSEIEFQPCMPADLEMYQKDHQEILEVTFQDSVLKIPLMWVASRCPTLNKKPYKPQAPSRQPQTLP